MALQRYNTTFAAIRKTHAQRRVKNYGKHRREDRRSDTRSRAGSAFLLVVFIMIGPLCSHAAGQTWYTPVFSLRDSSREVGLFATRFRSQSTGSIPGLVTQYTMGGGRLNFRLSAYFPETADERVTIGVQYLLPTDAFLHSTPNLDLAMTYGIGGTVTPGWSVEVPVGLLLGSRFRLLGEKLDLGVYGHLIHAVGLSSEEAGLKSHALLNSLIDLRFARDFALRLGASEHSLGAGFAWQFE